MNIGAETIFSKKILYLIAIGEFKTTPRVAEVFNVSKSSIARNLSDLEEIIGTRLFTGSATNGYDLTDDGEAIVNLMTPIVESTMGSIGDITHMSTVRCKYDQLPEAIKKNVIRKTLMDMSRDEVEQVIDKRKLQFNGLGQYELNE